MDLYNLYMADCIRTKSKCASPETFRKVYHQWRACLKFRPKSTHAACKECFQWKRRIRHAKSFKETVNFQIQYLMHLVSQWRDRLCPQKSQTIVFYVFPNLWPYSFTLDIAICNAVYPTNALLIKVRILEFERTRQIHWRRVDAYC